MKIIINNTSMVPIYEQIMEQIKAQIIGGDLQEDESLPSIRSLAKDLRISVIPTKRASEELEKEGLHVAVLHSPTIKPLDSETILAEIQKKPGRLVVTAENHTVVGGLGSLVANLLVDNQVPAKMKKIALPDQYLAAGTLETLQDLYGVSAKAVTEQLRNFLK